MPSSDAVLGPAASREVRAAPAMLDVADLSYAYGGVVAISDVTLQVGIGEIVSLLGSNGAGKSTTAKAVCGALRPRAGTVSLDGESIVGLPAYTVMRRGLVLVPEGRLVFAQMTVLDNLLMGAHRLASSPRVKVLREENFTRFPRLRERREQLAGSLSGGEQQMLAIARGLMSEPRMLVLDEPSLGLMPIFVREVFALIRRIAQDGISVLLIEQNARASLACSRRSYVLDKGRIILSGLSRDLARDEFVRNAYLGGDI